MTGNFIDTYRYKFKKIINKTIKNTFFVKTEYSEIWVLNTLGKKPVILNVPDETNVIERAS